jgi:orotate phosphoribosyltransferase
MSDPDSERAESILREAGAVITGDHFVYITGEHGDGWIDKDSLFPDTTRTSELCAMLAGQVADAEAELVCGPATGGLIVSQWTAHHLGLPSLFAEHGKDQGYDPAAALAADGPLRPPFVLRRGYDLAVAGKRVAVVDDVINTGESIRETVGAVSGAGGHVVIVGALCTRGNAGPGDLGCDRIACLCEISIPSWPAAECQLCHDGVAVNTRYAHGADFVAANS